MDTSFDRDGWVMLIILRQEEHHMKKTFKEEYLDFLNKFQILHEKQFLFEWFD